jgi:hypothetical protein
VRHEPGRRHEPRRHPLTIRGCLWFILPHNNFSFWGYTSPRHPLNKAGCRLFHKSYFLVNVLRCFYSLLNAFFYRMAGMNAAVNPGNSNVIREVTKRVIIVTAQVHYVTINRCLVSFIGAVREMNITSKKGSEGMCKSAGKGRMVSREI